VRRQHPRGGPGVGHRHRDSLDDDRFESWWIQREVNSIERATAEGLPTETAPTTTTLGAYTYQAATPAEAVDLAVALVRAGTDLTGAAVQFPDGASVMLVVVAAAVAAQIAGADDPAVP